MSAKEPTNVGKTFIDIHVLCKRISTEKAEGEPVATMTSSVLLARYDKFKTFLEANVDAQHYHLMCAVLYNVQGMISFLMAYNRELPYQPNERGVNTVDFAQHLIANVPTDTIHYQGATYFLEALKKMKQIATEQEVEYA